MFHSEDAPWRDLTGNGRIPLVQHESAGSFSTRRQEIGHRLQFSVRWETRNFVDVRVMTDEILFGLSSGLLWFAWAIKHRQIDYNAPSGVCRCNSQIRISSSGQAVGAIDFTGCLSCPRSFADVYSTARLQSARFIPSYLSIYWSSANVVAIAKIRLELDFDCSSSTGFK
ncbi:hypothetical protein DAPPUDRAFT_320632 [Daphnia pulex]|uniref:Uncharacterized protein n=1 Tax=Daphnia pulex TaxID=6669 RepID=E9GQP6_DAPPU|nr:hypothetical protein DAPPUDRAFT_320632 [Daphnia pulex]|eukprot:EFX78150.1 hypothetical protein DAPPUDRAFT_320632 [Daphnia pulex]